MTAYSFTDNVLTINGPGGSFTIGGAGAQNEKGGYDIDYVDNKNTMSIGADGSPMQSLNPSTASKLTVKLLKTSPVNSMLSSMYNTQKASSALWGQNVLTAMNKVLGDQVVMTQSAFTKFPKLTYDVEGAMNEWVFDCGVTDSSLGSGGTVAATVALVQQSL